MCRFNEADEALFQIFGHKSSWPLPDPTSLTLRGLRGGLHNNPCICIPLQNAKGEWAMRGGPRGNHCHRGNGGPQNCLSHDRAPVLYLIMFPFSGILSSHRRSNPCSWLAPIRCLCPPGFLHRSILAALSTFHLTWPAFSCVYRQRWK
jgi:hypothetical protein